jgi:hypothetical protein
MPQVFDLRTLSDPRTKQLSRPERERQYYGERLVAAGLSAAEVEAELLRWRPGESDAEPESLEELEGEASRLDKVILKLEKRVLPSEPLEEPAWQREQRERDAPVEAALARMGISRPGPDVPVMRDTSGESKLNLTRTRRRLVGEKLETLRRAERERKDGTRKRREKWDKRQAAIEDGYRARLQELESCYIADQRAANDEKQAALRSLGERP